VVIPKVCSVCFYPFSHLSYFLIVVLHYQLSVTSIAIDISIFWKSYRIRVVWTVCSDGYPYPRMFQLSRT
jgi:hypothetical protein